MAPRIQPALLAAVFSLLMPSVLPAASTGAKSSASSAKVPAPRYVDGLVAGLAPSKLVTYKRVGDRELKLHLFLPPGWKASDRHAAFVTFHGGGWGGGTAARMYPFAEHFARRGLVGISVEYRLLKPAEGVTVFDCVRDACSALRYVRAHAAELGIDPDRIVANGASAGGHLAAATALFPQVDDAPADAGVAAGPNALVLFYPVIDTSPAGYGNAKIGARWQELSPAHNVRPGLPPTLTFHGTGDTTTPFAGAKQFHEAMLKAGNVSQLDVNDGGIHGYLLIDRVTYEDTLAKTEAFLEQHGILPPR